MFEHYPPYLRLEPASAQVRARREVDTVTLPSSASENCQGNRTNLSCVSPTDEGLSDRKFPMQKGPFCEPHLDGALWDCNVHGVYLASESDCRSTGRRPYDHDSYWMAHACRSHGIATGLCVPQKAWLAIEKAYQHLAEPLVAAAWWSIARTILADAQARYGSAS